MSRHQHYKLLAHNESDTFCCALEIRHASIKQQGADACEWFVCVGERKVKCAVTFDGRLLLLPPAAGTNTNFYRL